MSQENTNKPYPIKVGEGKSYFICSCKLTKNQPFCDGSHHKTKKTPYKFDCQNSEEVYFCGCKLSKNFPLCDGSHNSLVN